MANPKNIKQILLSEIDKMGQHCEDFCKHPDDAFQKLFYHFNGNFRPKSLFNGRYQLLACDGSGFTFTKNPKDTESYYRPSGRSKKGYNQMYLVALYDLLNKVYTDAVIQPMRKRNEFAALYGLIGRPVPLHLPKGSF